MSVKYSGNLFRKVSMVHIELTTKCNARCPACLRSIDGGTTANPYIDLNQEIPLERLKEVFNDGLLDEIDELLICGNNGDALASKHLVPFLRYLEEKNYDNVISLHTNAGLGDKATWDYLAQFFSKKKRVLWFSVDGLEKTNHIYRRGVSWSRVENNMKSFIANGGRAKWKYIQFRHNGEDIERARKFAEELGFLDFQVRKNHSPHMEPFDVNFEVKPMLKVNPQINNISETELLKNNSDQNSSFHKDSISCIAEEEQSIFIDSLGKLWPCCWIGYADHDTSPHTRAFAQHFFTKKYGTDFNDLSKHTWRDILAHPWFSKDLKNSFSSSKDDSTNPCFHLCNKVCGKSVKQSEKIPRKGTDYEQSK